MGKTSLVRSLKRQPILPCPTPTVGCHVTVHDVKAKKLPSVLLQSLKKFDTREGTSPNPNLNPMTLALTLTPNPILDHKIRLQLCDMCGDDTVDSLGWALCETIDVVLIVFDVTNRDSFESVQGWMDATTMVRPSSGALPTFLIGNKMEVNPDPSPSPSPSPRSNPNP